MNATGTHFLTIADLVPAQQWDAATERPSQCTTPMSPELLAQVLAVCESHRRQHPEMRG